MNNQDDKILMKKWANIDKSGNLSITPEDFIVEMSNSDALAFPLIKHGAFGADIIKFGPGEKVDNHTHVGAHILFVIKGEGTVEYNQKPYDLTPGVCYLIPSMVPHAIKARADSELVLIAIGNDHRDADSMERMELV